MNVLGSIGALLRNENRIEFPRYWRPAAIVSGVIVAIAAMSLIVQGLNLGIEFEGGASWEVRSPTVEADELRDALEPLGLGDARIQQVANELWRVRAETESTAQLETVKGALAEAAGIPASDVTSNAVGASWGNQVTSKARTALIVFFIVLFIYISIRLEWKMAVGALAAVVHDILITVGIYSLFQLEVTSATVIAFLTILGYSLYDTLVVFDKIRENENRAQGAAAMTYTQVTSFSLNQVLMRSVNTTITSVLPVLAVLLVGRFILGAVTLQEFAIALLVGLLVGTYSSLFVATPIVARLKEREAANVERQIAAAKRGTDDADIARALADADRARVVRSGARGDGHRVTGVSANRAATRTAAAKSGSGSPTVTKRKVAGASDRGKSASGKTPERAPQGEIKPRPRKKKR
ncbi:MAG: protein translocase subunit SecF [Actinomycetota bacterium]